MNVYTHVAIDALATDIRKLSAVPGSPSAMPIGTASRS